MNDIIKKIAEKRRKFLDGVEANREDIDLDIFEEFYPDQAHFVFELLQNAEDAGATKVHFALNNDGCFFEHNGTRLFTEDDIRSITGIYKSTKKESSDKIGTFGIGFKSVFVYTVTPEIRSGEFSFRILEHIMPECLPDQDRDKTKTSFWFPFNNPKKPKDTAFTEVEAGFRNLAELVLLFLSKIDKVTWEINKEQHGAILRTEHSDDHIEVLKKTDGAMTASSHFLRFTRPVEGPARQTQHKVAVAFALAFLPDVKAFDQNVAIAKQMKISPVPGKVAVFFPAEKETSNLRFHLHAPFVPELSRASIKDTPVNDPLFEQLAELSASSLYKIRDYGLLTREFLEVLPNKQDTIPTHYEAIRESIIHAMKNEALTPTHDRSHAPARRLLKARASLKSLLSEQDIEFLVDYKDEAPLWAVAATQNNNNTDRFLDSLEITNWGMDEFVYLLADRTSERRRYVSRPPYFVHGLDSEFMKWLASKPIEWHQELYALLFSELTPEEALYRLGECRIVRLFNGEYSVGSECFFPDDGEQDDTLPLPRVAIEAYYSTGKNKSQQSNAQKFLEEIGVRGVGEAEQVESILKQRYICEAEKPDKETYRKDIKRFMALVEKEASQASLFKGFYIFKCAGDRWCMPPKSTLMSHSLTPDLMPIMKRSKMTPNHIL